MENEERRITVRAAKNRKLAEQFFSYIRDEIEDALGDRESPFGDLPVVVETNFNGQFPVMTIRLMARIRGRRKPFGEEL